MQTFLPYPDFAQSAACLDYRRLGKQRLECKQIERALFTQGGWRNHPAVKMWDGHAGSLMQYMRACILEWERRGYKNTMLYPPENNSFCKPLWFGDERFHSSHRAALLFKNYKWYSQFGWTETPEYNYFWPTHHKEYSYG